MARCADGGRLDYHFWRPESLGGPGNAPALRRAAAFEASPLRLHRLPALRLDDVEPKPAAPARRMLASPDRGARVSAAADDGGNGTAAAASSSSSSASALPPLRSCRAGWSKDGTVPVRCGADKTRYIVARVGAAGRADRASWPAVGADNRTATTADVELFAGPGGGGGELRVRCTPRWRRRDQSPPASAAATPLVTSAVVTFSEGPVFAGESALAWASNATELYFDSTKDPLDSLPFDESLRATASNAATPPRRLPRVISCFISADDPGNDGLPVYATGAVVALANASAPLGVELRSFSFPLTP